jgi:hypothetical protein
MTEGFLTMTDAARCTFTFHGLKRVPLVFATVFAAAILSCGFASAQPELYEASFGSSVEKMIVGGSNPQSGFNKFRSIVLAHDSSSSKTNLACSAEKEHACETLVQDNIVWKVDDPSSVVAKRWAQENLDDLCGCTKDPYATVNCFQVEVNNRGKTWQQAIETCRAKP